MKRAVFDSRHFVCLRLHQRTAANQDMTTTITNTLVVFVVTFGLTWVVLSLADRMDLLP
jgi:heme/copper-type cytochrome/quinol oxidase subunit 4